MKVQGTLDGETAERVQCEYYDGCKSDALFIGELLVFTDHGDEQQIVRACPSCAAEHVEPESPQESDTWSRMKPSDRYVGEKPKPNSVYAVVTAYVDDPHPHVEGVFADREPAEELMDDCRAIVGQPSPDAWCLYKLTPGQDPELVDP